MSDDPTKVCRDATKLAPIMQECLAALWGLRSFIVVETLRTHQRQLMLLKQGKSKTLHSRHLTGMAMDIMPKGGYDKWVANDWEKAHDEWDAIVITKGRQPEKRIAWDMGHFGILGNP